METQKEKPLEILEKWLIYAKNGDWEKMVELCQLTWLSGENEAEEYIKSLYLFHYIKKWGIITQIENAECKKRYLVPIITAQGNYYMKPNVICEIGPFTPDVGGTWGINPISAMLKKSPIEEYKPYIEKIEME